MSEQRDLDRADNYARGKMSEKEEVEFEAEFMIKPELFEEVQTVTILRDGIHELYKNVPPLQSNVGENEKVSDDR